MIRTLMIILTRRSPVALVVALGLAAICLAVTPAQPTLLSEMPAQLSPPIASGQNLFGPATYSALRGTTAAYQAIIPPVELSSGTDEREAVLVILNRMAGMDGPHVDSMDRVTSGLVMLNGRAAASINSETGQLVVPIRLRPGANVLGLRLVGGPLASITVAVRDAVQPAPMPLTSSGGPAFHAGVLQLAYGSITPPYALEFCLKNQSLAHSRTVRLACVDTEGRFSDVSPVFDVKPNGAVVIRLPAAGLQKPRNAGQVIAPDPWREGSVNVIWVGRGAEPVTGYVISGELQSDGRLRERVVLPLEAQVR